jgi:hypothetical protein
MSDGYKEYDPNEYLGGVQTPAETPTGYKEYDPNAYLTQVTQSEKPPTFLESLKSKASNVLKGAEYFAKGGAFAPKRTKEAVESMASLADTTIGSVIPSAGSYLIQGATRPFTTPEKAAEYGQKFAEATDKPFGKALGVTESPAYKNEASNRFMQYVSKNMDKGADYIAEKTGLPKADVAHMMNTVSMAGGYAAGKVAIPASVKTTAKELVTGKKEPKIFEEPSGVVSDLQNQFAAKKAALMEGKPLVEPTPEPTKGFADVGFKQPEQTPPVVAKKPQTAPKASVEVSQPTEPVIQAPKQEINPALQQKADQLKAQGKDVDNEALIRQSEALDVDPRLQFTEGQARQDANLISTERNERGIKEKFVDTFNEQNRILKERAEKYKEEFTPDIKGTSFVQNSGFALDAVDTIIKNKETVAKDAYADLKALEAGKSQIDGKTFGEQAKAALDAEDAQDYVPSQILKRLDAYADGSKEMNFNLFENLRTKIAAESRKADRAGDGNTVHALSLVRNELEKLPIKGEGAEAKVLADKARSAFKANRDLESSNQFYKEATSGKLDTANLIQKTAFGTKNSYFDNAMEILNADPKAKQHFAQGTLDYMIRESTDGSGNLNVMKMANLIDDLELNGRLTAIYGEENAAKLSKYARVARYTKSQPEGSFVNTSNTAVGGAAMVQKYGPAAAEVVGAKLGLPFVGEAVQKGTEFLNKRKVNKQVEKATEFGAGIEKGTPIGEIDYKIKD